MGYFSLCLPYWLLQINMIYKESTLEKCSKNISYKYRKHISYFSAHSECLLLARWVLGFMSFLAFLINYNLDESLLESWSLKTAAVISTICTCSLSPPCRICLICTRFTYVCQIPNKVTHFYCRSFHCCAFRVSFYFLKGKL